MVPRDAAALAWMANLACLELHPHPVMADDLDHPNELRVDLDPVPGVEWRQVQDVARVVRATLADVGLVGWPKTSGSRGIHVNVRIHQRWSFVEVRRAAVAFAREIERRAPAIATSKWWKEERHGVFIDYNQNAKDRTVASAFSVRPRPDARVSTPLTWEEIDACDPADFTLKTMPAWFKTNGDRHADIDRHPGSLDALLELSAKQEKEGLGDAPWPPQYKKMPGEPTRVQPSRAHKGRRASKFPLIEVARSTKKDEALEQLEAWKRKHSTVAALLEPADVLVDSMRGRSSTWTRIRINLQHVPEKQRPKAPQLPPLPNPWAELIRRSGTEDRGKLESRNDLELIVATVVRWLVVAPAQERGGVAKPVALHVVVLHFADPLDAHRLPRQVLARAPTALAAWHALRHGLSRPGRASSRRPA